MTQLDKSIKELTIECQKLVKELNDITTLKAEFTVNETMGIVKFGEDTFYIKNDKLKEYLDNRIKRFKLLIQAAKGEIDVEEFSSRNNQLTLDALSYHDHDKKRRHEL